MSSIAIPTPFSRHWSGVHHVRVMSAISIGRYTLSALGASGDISLKPGETSNNFIAWYQPQGGTYNPSPIVYGANYYYYTLYDRGFFTCHDAKTGKEVYSKR